MSTDSSKAEGMTDESTAGAPSSLGALVTAIDGDPSVEAAPTPPGTPPDDAATAGGSRRRRAALSVASLFAAVGLLFLARARPDVTANAAQPAKPAVAATIPATAPPEEEPARASSPGLRPAAAAAPPEEEPPPDAVAPPDKGLLTTAGGSPHRRIFVDGRTVGETPDSALVPCGVRHVQIGSAGATWTIDVPCGGEINLGERASP